VKRAYQMVEELMLLANQLVARWLIRRRAPTVFRVHDKPDAEKLERFGAVAKQLSVRVDLDAMLTPAGVTRFLTSIQTHPRRAVLEMLLLRSMKQAVYDVTNLGHFGLASDAYLHFTSPIRRYPDLAVHRVVKHLLRGGKPDESPTAVEALRAAATTASLRERATADVEREVVDLYRALLMLGRVGDIFEGTVTGIGGGGLYVALDAPFVDVLVRFEALGPDHYEAGDDEISARGLRSGDTISLGDRITVEIDDVALLRRTVYAKRVVPDDVAEKARRRPGKRGAAHGPKPPARGGRSYKPGRGSGTSRGAKQAGKGRRGRG
jgi:ribonuclease R